MRKGPSRGPFSGVYDITESFFGEVRPLANRYVVFCDDIAESLFWGKTKRRDPVEALIALAIARVKIVKMRTASAPYGRSIVRLRWRRNCRGARDDCLQNC